MKDRRGRIKIGPLAEWVAGVEHERLTVEGQRLVTEFMRQYSPPIRLYIHTHGNQYSALRKSGASDDEINEACVLGVVEAATKFDPARGLTFSSYAEYWMWAKCARVLDDLQKCYASGVYVTSIHDAGEFDYDPPDHRGESVEDREERQQAKRTVERLMGYVHPSKRPIFASLFGLDGTGRKNLQEVADQFGISRERVRQVREECYATIRKYRRQAVGV